MRSFRTTRAAATRSRNTIISSPPDFAKCVPLTRAEQQHVLRICTPRQRNACSGSQVGWALLPERRSCYDQGCLRMLSSSLSWLAFPGFPRLAPCARSHFFAERGPIPQDQDFLVYTLTPSHPHTLTGQPRRRELSVLVPGYWRLARFDPRPTAGKTPLALFPGTRAEMKTLCLLSTNRLRTALDSMRAGIMLEFNNDAGSAVLLSVSPEPPGRSYNLGDKNAMNPYIRDTCALVDHARKIQRDLNPSPAPVARKWPICSDSCG